ncbi:hypothetical protein [Bacillus sp. REN10]|uniref:hypothetical protein n=1 Tax=Bacillus sp. REN10 TaxID=2782541 RepID=UPI00193AF9DE|nr:hypothetical protein [Bacillus sp. REN10]
MKRKLLFIGLLIVSVSVLVLIYSLNKSNQENNRIVVNSMEEFQPTKKGKESQYLLFYPADKRNSQDYTFVREVSKTGEIVKEYEIRDDTFRRMSVHQKPNELNKLYISFFGEAVIENWYYTYDIEQGTFKKVDLDYFNFDVGVDHIKHYGSNVLFQSMVSYKTGDQNTNKNNDFNMSITNDTTKNSYETEYGRAPNWTPLLQFEDKIIYAGSGQVNDEGIADNNFVGLIDSKNKKANYMNFNKGLTEFYPIYATSKNAFIMNDEGKLFVLDRKLSYKTYEIFKDLPQQDKYYDVEGSLLLNEETALYSIYNEKSGVSLGVLSFKDTPSFTVLDENYINKKMTYRILYQNTKEKEIYMIESDGNGKGNLLVVDTQTFNLINKIPIEEDHLLDFVVKL